MNYPDHDSEVQLLLDQPTDDPDFSLEPVMHRDELIQLQALVRHVQVDRKVANYVVELAGATRRDSRLRVGCSPRGSKMLLRAAQARAVLLGREFVVPDDIQALAVEVMGHRMSLRSVSATVDDTAHIVRELVAQTEVPV
jgi:MoxR-like ATPase